jgi:hypothetical protein
MRMEERPMAPDAIRNEEMQDAAPLPDTTEDNSPRLRGGLKPLSTLQMIIAFAVIAMSLFGLFQLSGLWKRVAPLPMPTQTPTPAATATLVPTGTPTGTPAPTVTPTATPEPELLVGVLATVNGTGAQQLKMRAAPGLDQQLLSTLLDGTRLRVLEGPQTKDGYSWWKVQTEDGLQGWVAGDWLVPTAP